MDVRVRLQIVRARLSQICESLAEHLIRFLKQLHWPSVISLILHIIAVICYIYGFLSSTIWISPGISGGLWELCGAVGGVSLGGNLSKCFILTAEELVNTGHHQLGAARTFSIVIFIVIISNVMWWIMTRSKHLCPYTRPTANDGRIWKYFFINYSGLCRIYILMSAVLLLLLVILIVMVVAKPWLPVSNEQMLLLYSGKVWGHGAGFAGLCLACLSFFGSMICILWIYIANNINNLCLTLQVMQATEDK